MIGTGLPLFLRPSANHDERKSGRTPTILLLHYTGMDSAESACTWLCNEQSKVSCHYLIDEQGGLVQMVSEDRRAWHAGASTWRGIDDINSMSIGVEIHNTGHNGVYEDFPALQMQTVVALCRDVVIRNSIKPENILAHSDVAPGRKTDPGEKFDWPLLYRNGIGHWVEPSAISGGIFLQEGDRGESVAALQLALQRYGYGIVINGQFEYRTRIVIEAFQRHFRPSRVDGIADQSTIDTLFRLLAGVQLAT